MYNNDDKIFNLLEKVYIELQDTKLELQDTKKEVKENGNRLTKIELTLENVVEPNFIRYSNTNTCQARRTR